MQGNWQQGNWQHEGAIKNGQCRETGNTKGQSKMDSAGKLAARRGNQKWTMQGNWYHRVQNTKKKTTQ
jgi:hypothetical protein